MNVKATAKFVRISPQKTRLVVGLIRSLPVEVARQQLQFSKKEAAQAVLKVLDSALANARHNFGLDVSGFYVNQAFSDEGPKIHRYRARARGSAAPIRKRMSHITIAVGPKGEKLN
jgi:large subunit ribosomal protein L22